MLDINQRNLVESCVGLARAIGHKEWKKLSGYDRDEVISWAFQGLVAAAARWPEYCREHDYEMYTGDAPSWFQTYASRRIRGSIVDALRASDVATRQERSIVKKIYAAGVDLSSPWEHESAESVAAQANLSPAEVRRAVSALVRFPVSMDEVSEDSRPVDPRSVEEEASEELLGQRVTEAVKALPPMHFQVIVLFAYRGLSDSEIAREIPMLNTDPYLSPWSVQWVAVLRDQAQRMVSEAVAAELSVEIPQLAAS